MITDKKLRAGPYPVKVKAGERYKWCSCGLSKSQPWCDGSHIGTEYEPIRFTAPINGVFYMCGCKQSENAPYCFGNCTGNARRSLADKYRFDTP